MAKEVIYTMVKVGVQSMLDEQRRKGSEKKSRF